MSKKVFQMRQVVSILRNRQQVMLCNDYVNNEDDVFIRVGNKMSATPFAEQIYQLLSKHF